MGCLSLSLIQAEQKHIDMCGELFSCNLTNILFCLFSFTDEVDVMGCSSNQSDSDDSSVKSIKSVSTDSGVDISASRLTLFDVSLY